MKAQGEGGRIINAVGSISAHRARPPHSPLQCQQIRYLGIDTGDSTRRQTRTALRRVAYNPGNTYVERHQNRPQEPMEPMMDVDDLAQAAVLMATLPPHINMLEATVLPVGQLYIGRG